MPNQVWPVRWCNKPGACFPKPAFEWSTLKLGGDTAASEAELAALVAAATQGTVGIARATKLKLN